MDEKRLKEIICPWCNSATHSGRECENEKALMHICPVVLLLKELKGGKGERHKKPKVTR